MLAVAVAAGGGGSPAAEANLAVQLASLLILALHGRAVAEFALHAPLALRVLVSASLLLPLIQIVPLPPGIWQVLPGRELVAETLDLVGERGWFPLSMDGGRTLLAFLALVGPVAILAIGWSVTPRRLVQLQHLVIALGTASALFGSLHLFTPGWGDIYAGQRPMPGVLVGTFADRNAAALFYGGCLLLLAGIPTWPRSLTGRGALSLLAAFLALAVVLTGSRSGIALLVIPAALGIWRAAKGSGLGRLAPFGALLAVGAAIGFVVASQPTRLDTVVARFSDGDEMRSEMRADALYAARHYWPAGAGMGTFDEVFQLDESLEYVSPRRAGRAHMDYLELAIEAGLAGVILLAGWAGWMAVHGWKAVRRPGAWPARAAMGTLTAIAAQSLLSFPLRNGTMLCMAAFALLLLARSPSRVRPGDAP